LQPPIDYPALRTQVRSFWTDTHLYLLFTCPYKELNLFLPAQNGGPRDKLWDRDVVEMFLGDDWTNIRHYREFEIAPTGDWIDLAIDLDRESYDQSWRSGWTTAARIDETAHVWYAAARIPLSAVSSSPVKPGTKWRANLYRIEGQGPDARRHFLCWQPTCVVNRDPNHVPENFGTLVFTGGADSIAAGRQRFEERCGGCHGADGMGGERAPAIGSEDRERLRSDDAVRSLIHDGIPDAGMPAFALKEPELSQIVAFVRSRVTPARESMPPGDPAAGQAFFFGAGGCAQCHMMNGRGGVTGPDLSNAGSELTLAEMEQSLLKPAARRKPGFEVATVRLRSGAACAAFCATRVCTISRCRASTAGSICCGATRWPASSARRRPTCPRSRPAKPICGNLIAYLANPRAISPPRERRPARRARLGPHRPSATRRLAHLSRPTGRQPLQRARPDYAAQRGQLAPRWIFPDPQCAASGSDSGGGGRRHVRDQRECRLGARRRHRPRDLALRTAPQQRPFRATRRAASTAAWRCWATACSWSPTTPI
jgi:mono/diheme cytochrome c family protein